MITENMLDWTVVPHTDRKATAIAHSVVPAGRRVIKVTNGSIRGSTLSGYFLVVQGDNPTSTYNEKQRIEVECLWYGKKPKTTWMHLTVNNGFEYVQGYDGKVISNIGR